MIDWILFNVRSTAKVMYRRVGRFESYSSPVLGEHQHGGGLFVICADDIYHNWRIFQFVTYSQKLLMVWSQHHHQSRSNVLEIQFQMFYGCLPWLQINMTKLNIGYIATCCSQFGYLVLDSFNKMSITRKYTIICVYV